MNRRNWKAFRDGFFAGLVLPLTFLFKPAQAKKDCRHMLYNADIELKKHKDYQHGERERFWD